MVLIVVEVWKAKKDEEIIPLKTTLISQASVYLEYLTVLITAADINYFHPPLNTVNGNGFSMTLTEESAKVLLLPLIMHWLQLPQFELLTQIISIFSLNLSNPHISYFDDVSTPYIIPKSLYIFLYNALVNRLLAPFSYTFDSIASSTAAVAGTAGQTNAKQSNVIKSTALLMDLILNLIIDSNSSDHIQLHGYYTTMGLNVKLATKVRPAFMKQYEDLARLHASLVNPGATTSTAEDGEMLVEKKDVEKLEETICNLDNFIEYKDNLSRLPLYSK
jgi:hypothetical protein